MLRPLIRALPLFAVGVAALAGSLAACVREVEPVVSEDPLDDYGYTPTYGYEAAAEAPPAPTCAPMPVHTTWHPPQPLHQGVCSGAQADMVVRCFVTFEGDFDTCHAFAAANPACVSCAISRETAPKYGALYRDHTGVLHDNAGGCIAQTTQDLSKDGCGAGLVLSEQCMRDACAACRYDDAEAAHCDGIARSGVCSRYDYVPGCVEAATAPGGPAAACRVQGALADRARTLIPLFCGN